MYQKKAEIEREKQRKEKQIFGGFEGKENIYDKEGTIIEDESERDVKSYLVDEFLSGQIGEKEKEKIRNGELGEDFKEKYEINKKEEIIEKLANREWRMNNLYYIVSEDGERIKFKFNRIQTDIFRDSKGKRRAIILKYRQGGVSTYYGIDLLDDFLWGGRHNYNVIVAHERKLLITLFKKIKFAYDYLDPEFKVLIPPIDSDNANELYIRTTDNRLAVTLDTRGETPTKMHVTELAWRTIENQRKIILAMNSMRKTVITIESTANGVGDPFHGIVQQSRVGKGTYLLLFYPWFIEERNTIPLSEGEVLIYDEREKNLIKLHNVRDDQLKWRRRNIEDAMALGEDGNKLFDQENPDTIDTAFVSSGTQVFPLDSDFIINKPEKVIGDFKIFGKPEDKMVFGIDTAGGGAGGDYSVIVGMNSLGKVLVTYRKKVEAYTLAEAMDLLFTIEHKGKKFLGTILVERNMGQGFIIEAQQYQWRYRILLGQDAVAIADKTKKYFGFWTGKTSKMQLIRDLRKGFFSKTVQITEQIYNEIGTYVIDNSGSANAMSGHHDDLLMGTMLALHGVWHYDFTISYPKVQAKEETDPYKRAHLSIISGKFKQDEYSGLSKI